MCAVRNAQGAARGISEKARKIRDRIRDNFDRGAADYDRFEAETAFFRELLDALLGLAPSLNGARVLDVGCGTGAAFQRLQEAVGDEGEVWGIDISLGMLREAHARSRGGVRLALMDGCSFGAGFRASFDAVVYNAVLFMLPDARASLESADQVLAPGGSVLLSHLEGAYLPDLACSVPDLLTARGFPAGRHALSPWPAVVPTLEALFETPTVSRLRRQLTADMFEAFYGLEPMSAGLLPSLPYAERRRIVADFAREWRRDGTAVEQVWNLAHARKPV